jgi:hypothetical protein
MIFQNFSGNKKRQSHPIKPLEGYLTGFESSGGRISDFIVWEIKYSILDSLGVM